MDFTKMTAREIQNTAMNCNAKVNPALANMRSVFEQHEDKADWKNPFVATVSPEDMNLLVAAVIWFHGATPLVVGNKVATPGYQG